MNEIEFNGEKYVKKSSVGAVEPSQEESIYKIGAKVFIRTVTLYMTGRIVYVGDDEIGLEESAWIADTGRFSDALKTGQFSEVEPVPVRQSVGRGAIVDAFVWKHDLPTEKKP